MANGYDAHSMGVMEMKEAAASSDMPAFLTNRFEKKKGGAGKGDTEAREATTLDPGGIGQNPPSIMYGAGEWVGGTATRTRGRVDEAAVSWERAQEATTPQIKPRVTVPSEGDMRENADWMGDWDDSEHEDCGTGFPDEEEARDALGVLSQFVEPSLVKGVQDAIVTQFGDPEEPTSDDIGWLVPAEESRAA